MSIAPVVINFMAQGVPDIARAFRSTQQILQNSERSTVRGAENTSKRIQAIRERSASMAGRFAAKEAATEQRERDRAARSADQNAKRLQGIRERSASMAGRLAAKEATAEQRERERGVRSAERAAKRIQAIRERSASMAGKFAAKEAAAETREREKEARKSARLQKQIHAETVSRREMYVRAVGAGVSNAAGLVSRGASSLANTVTQLGGGFSVADSLQEKVSLERNAQLLSNNTNQGPGTRISKDRILARVRASSIDTNTDEAELMKGLNSYVAKTGKYEEADKNLSFYGKVAKSTGSDVGAVMRTAGTLAVQNEGMSAEDLKQLTLSTVMQARKGSVEFEDMARAGGKITRTAVSFAGSQTDRQRELLGLSQIGMRTAGNDVAEAATNIANLSSDATKHRGDVEKLLGRKFLNSQGQIDKGPGEFMAELMEKSGGDLTKLQSAGFNTRSQKMFQALSPVFNNAKADALKGGASAADANKAGSKAVLENIKQISSGKYDEKDLEADFGEVMKTSAEQFEGTVRTLKQEVGDRLVPELIKLVPILSQLTPKLAQFLEGVIKMAEWAAKNPFETLAVLITGSIIKEIAAAQIGTTIKSLLSGSAGGGGGVGVPGAATGGGTTIAGSSGGTGLAAGGLIAAGALAQSAYLGQQVDRVTNAQSAGDKQAEELKKLAASGPDGAAKAQQAVAAAQGNSGAADWVGTAVTATSRASKVLNPFAMAGQYAGDYVAEKVSGKAPADVAHMEQTIAAQQVASRAQEIDDASKKLATAMTNAANNVDAANPNSDARNKPLNGRGGTP